MSMTAAIPGPQGGTSAAFGDGFRLLLAAAGNGALLAELLGVTPAQITRWKQGAQAPSAESARGIMDFAYIVARAEAAMHEKVVPIWLDSPNQFLRGATPRECIRLGRVAEVIGAIDAEDEGAYA